MIFLFLCIKIIFYTNKYILFGKKYRKNIILFGKKYRKKTFFYNEIMCVLSIRSVRSVSTSALYEIEEPNAHYLNAPKALFAILFPKKYIQKV